MTVTNGTWSSQFTQAGRLELGGDLSITTIANATVDTDKFLVSDSGVLKYRTGAEVLSDIGGISLTSISTLTSSKFIMYFNFFIFLHMEYRSSIAN